MSKIVKCTRCDGVGVLEIDDELLGNFSRRRLWLIRRRIMKLSPAKRIVALRRLRDLLKEKEQRCPLCKGLGHRMIKTQNIEE